MGYLTDFLARKNIAEVLTDIPDEMCLWRFERLVLPSRLQHFFFKQMGSFRILRVGMLFHIRILLEFQSISKNIKI